MNSTTFEVARKSMQAAVTALLVVCGGSVAIAGPQGETVIAGTATVSTDINNNTTIVNSDGTIINWDSFVIDAGTITLFQQGTDSRVLNRVVGVIPTEINGTLRSDGHVFLIDPNGIAVGSSGIIDTNGIVLSTLNLSNDQFQRGGDLKFTGSGGQVVNNGKIDAGSGEALLLGGSVINNGDIQSGQYVLLAAGEDIFIEGTLSEGLTVTTSGSGSVLNTASGTTSAIVGLVAADARNDNEKIATDIVFGEDGVLELTAKDGPGEPGGTDGQPSDGGTDGGTDGNTDGGSTDGGTDGTTDGGSEGGTDGSTDGGTDGGTDGSTDGGTDGGTDGSTDGGTDGGTDGTTDSGTDGGTDGTTDGATVGTTDGGTTDGGTANTDGSVSNPTSEEDVTEETQVVAVALVTNNEAPVTDTEDDDEDEVKSELIVDSGSPESTQESDSPPNLCR